MRLFLAALLCVVALPSAVAENTFEYVFKTPSTADCQRTDGVVGKPMKDDFALKIMGIRVVIANNSALYKGKIDLTLAGITPKGTEKIAQQNTMSTPFKGQEEMVKALIARNPKYVVQVYVYIDTHGANSALDFGAPEALFKRSSYAQVSATDNPYFAAPVRFESIEIKLNGKMIKEYKNSNSCNKETSSNWIGQPGIYKLADCDGDDCGGKGKTNYMWKRMYYDPADGYVQL